MVDSLITIDWEIFNFVQGPEIAFAGTRPPKAINEKPFVDRAVRIMFCNDARGRAYIFLALCTKRCALYIKVIQYITCSVKRLVAVSVSFERLGTSVQRNLMRLSRRVLLSVPTVDRAAHCLLLCAWHTEPRC